MDGANPGDNYTPYGNGFLRLMQALVEPNVISVTTGTPPATPSNGNTYVIPVGATGIWAGKAGQIAYYTTDNLSDVVPGWDYYTPIAGWQVYNNGDGNVYQYNGSTWVKLATGGPLLENGGTPNSSQTVLNLTAGSNITLADLGSGQIQITSATGGTVNSGTSGQVVYYASSGNAVSGNANVTVSAGALTLGVAASVAGSVLLSGSTSGGATLKSQAVGGSLVISLPNTAPTVNQLLAATAVGGSNVTLGWRTISSPSIIQGALLTASSGSATWTFATSYASAPNVVATAVANGGNGSCNVQSVSTTQAVFNVGDSATQIYAIAIGT